MKVRRKAILKTNSKGSGSILTSTPRRRCNKRIRGNLNRNLLQSIEVDERISNIAFICDETTKPTITTPHRAAIDTDTKLSQQIIVLKSQRDRRYSIVNKRRSSINSLKINRELRESSRTKAKRERSKIYNACRRTLNENSAIESDDDDETSNALVLLNNANYIEKVHDDTNNNRYNFDSFERLLDAKQNNMPYLDVNDSVKSSLEFRSTDVCLSGGGRNSTKTIYPNTSGSRRIPYMRFSKSMSRQTMSKAMANDVFCRYDSIDRPRIRLTDLSWQHLDPGLQSVVVFFVLCFALNVYQLLTVG